MTSPSARKLAPENERVALVLQGGGALGAYQAGVFEELTRSGAEPSWIAGVSIGAINAALIAGNAPGKRVEKLHAFWDLVSSGPARNPPLIQQQRSFFNQWSANWAATVGVPGFYSPRVPPAMLQPAGSAGALSVYDSSALRSTLEGMVDFNRINDERARLRFSVEAVDVETGDSEWFDNTTGDDGPTEITVDHILASGALPPAFGPVAIAGVSYWDGGIVSNTPLQYVLDTRPDEKLVVVQVDLFPAQGALPVDLPGVLQRHKDIMYASRARFASRKIEQLQLMRGALKRLIGELPEPLRDDPDVRKLDAMLHTQPVDIFHLIYRQTPDEFDSKDYEFSRPSMREHWNRGMADMKRTHEHPERLATSSPDVDITVHDLGQDHDKARAARPSRSAPEMAALRALPHALARRSRAPATAAAARSKAVRKRA